MSEQIVLPKPVWACGVTMYPPYQGEAPKESYVFFELDKPDQTYFDQVIQAYADLDIPVLSQKIRRGFHFFGDISPEETRRRLQRKLAHINFDGSYNTTLRVKRKTEDEIYEKSIWHGKERPNWCKALQYFITLEYRNLILDYDQAAKQCGLYKYFKPQEGHYIIFYPLCPLCLTSLPTKYENVLKHYQQVHRMYREIKV